ncbi:ABC transporter substrate-binding protein, partial [Bacteroidota bacterium]
MIVLLCSCSPTTDKTGSADSIDSGNQYAKGFRIETYDNFSILHVQDPWQGSSGTRLGYVLSNDLDRIPDSLSHLPAIQTPVSRLICMSTTHVAMIDALDMTQTIVGVSGPNYISNKSLRKRIKSGYVEDVGADQALNYERIVSLKPDVVIAYGITAEVTGMVKRLGELGIPVILNGDYLENEPLGKTEWIKFMAVLFNREKEADSIFRKIETEYLDYQKLLGRAGDRPGVMTGLPWKDSWYIPGGNSFAAAFIRDAGGDYIWSDMDSHEASPVDLESVFARSSQAEIWINSGAARSMEDIRKTDSRLAEFRPYRQGNVYNNTARLNPTGGNDFWEQGV